jgi:hypothetical protein
LKDVSFTGYSYYVYLFVLLHCFAGLYIYVLALWRTSVGVVLVTKHKALRIMVSNFYFYFLRLAGGFD